MPDFFFFFFNKFLGTILVLEEKALFLNILNSCGFNQELVLIGQTFHFTYVFFVVRLLFWCKGKYVERVIAVISMNILD